MLSPCFFCGTLSKDGICAACRKRLDRERDEKELTLLFCEGARTVFSYRAEPVRRLLFGLKMRGLRLCAREFAAALFAPMRSFGVPFSCITYVPRRREERARRGTDQAKLLARELSRMSGIPCVPLLRRRSVSRRQHGLDPAARRENVRGKFLARGHLPRGDLLVVDDVITTGATMEEVCRVLLAAGADAVWVLAPVRGGSL